MILTVKVDAGMQYAQEVKEILAMRVEPLGVCRVIRIDDDGYGAQDSFLRGQQRGIASPVCAPVRNDEDQTGAGRRPGSGFASSAPSGHLPRGEGSAAAQIGMHPLSQQADSSPMGRAKGQEIPGLGGPYDNTLRYCYELMERRRREAAGNG